MSILINKDTRLLVQGITGGQGTFHSGRMIAAGTNIVAGSVPGKGGQKAVGDVPVFDSVQEAVNKTGANASIIFVPARFAADAITEAADAGLPLIVCLTEHIPVMDMIRVRNYIDKGNTRLIGPNCPGLVTPGECNVGIISNDIVKPGPIGVVSKSGTLTYEVVYALTYKGLGQSTCVGIGGDPINGTNFIDILRMFEADDQTEEIILMGEIGGNDEENAAEFIKNHVTKPVTAFIAGATAPPGRRMGHAGAIVEGSSGTAQGKIDALREAGARIAQHPEQIVDIIVGR
ncbi:MAG: succinyl-CoA synthetase alpha subunit [Cellvibrionaceae bacterium]|jgi:succinyl-CoA synthetase alpha subunit